MDLVALPDLAPPCLTSMVIAQRNPALLQELIWEEGRDVPLDFQDHKLPWDLCLP